MPQPLTVGSCTSLSSTVQELRTDLRPDARVALEPTEDVFVNHNINDLVTFESHPRTFVRPTDLGQSECAQYLDRGICPEVDPPIEEFENQQEIRVRLLKEELGTYSSPHDENIDSSLISYLLSYLVPRSSTAGQDLPNLGEWSRVPEFVSLACWDLGIPLLDVDRNLNLGEHAFPCVLPSGNSRERRANLWVNDHGRVVYRNRSRVARSEWLTLPEVKALVTAKRIGRNDDGLPRQLESMEIAIWQLRMIVSYGLHAPARIPRADQRVERELSNAEASIWCGFLLLLECKWLLWPKEPTTFSARFAGEWCGLSKSQADRVIKSLVRKGLLTTKGKEGRATLYEPGPATQLDE